MIITIFMIVAGIYTLLRERIFITRNRYVSGGTAKLIGVILLIGGFLGPLALVALIVAIGIGLASAEHRDGDGKTLAVDDSFSIYQSPGTMARVAIVLLACTIIADGVAIWSRGQELQLIERVANFERVTDQEIDESDSRQTTIGIIGLGLLIVTGITFMSWMTRCYNNIIAFRAAGRQYSPRWAWGGWLIPIISLIRPVQVIREIWRASDVNVDVTDDGWQSGSVSSMVNWWWAAWLGGSVFGWFISGSLNSAQTIDDFMNLSRMLMYSNVINVVGAILAVKVVQNLTLRQEMKQARLLRDGFYESEKAKREQN